MATRSRTRGGGLTGEVKTRRGGLIAQEVEIHGETARPMEIGEADAGAEGSTHAAPKAWGRHRQQTAPTSVMNAMTDATLLAALIKPALRFAIRRWRISC